MSHKNSTAEELQEIKALYNELLTPGKTEFDERRIGLLRGQIYQLERQILLLSDALSSRKFALQECEADLVSVADVCRDYIKAEVSGPDVPVKRCHLTRMVETIESCRCKLNKPIQNSTKEKLFQPLVYMNPYIKDGFQDETTLFDVCNGELQSINLKRVAELESKLSRLYSNLTALTEAIRVCTLPSKSSINPLLLDQMLQLGCHSSHLSYKIEESSTVVKDCCEELLPLSLLYPAAPWAELKKPVLKDTKIDDVISALPSMPRPKQAIVTRVLEDLMKVTNHKIYIQKKQIEQLTKELKFHQSVYTLQHDYVQSLFSAISDGYSEFEHNLSNTMSKPITDVLDSFDRLQQSTSESDMRRLLETLQVHSSQLRTLCSDLKVPSEAGTSNLSNFRLKFQESLNKHCRKCKKSRETDVQQLEVLGDDQQLYESLFRETLAEGQAKRKEMKSKPGNEK